MLTLTFLGVGSAFSKRNLQSNVLIEAWEKGPETQSVPDDTLLIDYGTTGPLALFQLSSQAGFEYLQIDGAINYPAIHRIFITHQHADHIGGLEEMALMNAYHFGERKHGKPHKPQIISSLSILMNLWDHSLKGGLSVMAGRYALLQDYFFILALNPADSERNQFTMLKRYRMQPVPTDHIHVERKYDWPSYGLLMEDTRTGQSAFFTGDTRYDFEAYRRYMEPASICFHDVQLFDEPRPVHALISELRQMPEAIRKKTHLYHYGDNWDSPAFADVPGQFAGFAQPGKRYRLFE